MTNIEEIWKPIPGFEGLYEASNFGRLKSVSKYIVNGGIPRRRKEKVLRPSKNHKGYLLIVLSKDGIRTTAGAHRHILSAFEGPSNLMIDHINGVKDDNRLENLRYCSARENTTFFWQKKSKSSKYVGVTKHGEKWIAQRYGSGKGRYLGIHSTEEEAKMAYENHSVSNQS